MMNDIKAKILMNFAKHAATWTPIEENQAENIINKPSDLTP